MTESKICTCPSGDGSLRWPCPKHPAVEHERAEFEAWVRRDCPGAPLRFTRDALPVDDPRYGQYCDDALQRAWVGWQARAALAQPSSANCETEWSRFDPFFVVDHIRRNTIFDADLVGRMLDFAIKNGPSAQPSPAQAEQAEAERPEVVAWRYGFSGGIVSDKACLDEWKSGGEYQSLMTVAQHERIVKAWIERWKAYIELSAKIAAQRDAANARLHEVATACATAEQERDVAQARVAELERGKVYVEARRCDECQHDGINDSATGVAACHECDWTGPEPEEDKCPGCQRENCMAAACPQCGARYVLVASEEIAAPVAQAQQLHDLDKQCRDDVARALGLRPSQERGFAWSYLLASIKSCVKASEDAAQAQHSVPETINEEANSFLRIADAGQFKDNAVAVRTAAVIIRGLLHRPPLMQSIIRHRIGLTPEYEGQWHADLYGEDGEVQHHAEADTPDEAVRAVVALAAAPGKEGV